MGEVMKWFQYRTYSEHTLNIPWIYSEHTLVSGHPCHPWDHGSIYKSACKMEILNPIEFLTNVLEETVLRLNLTLNLEKMWQASGVYSERNRKMLLGLVLVFIYLDFNNWPLLLLVTFLVYQVEDNLFLLVEGHISCRRWRQRSSARRTTGSPPSLLSP